MLGFLRKAHITIISPNNLHEPASYHEVGTDDELFDNSVVYREMKSQFATVLQSNKQGTTKKHQPWHHIRPSALPFFLPD